MKMVAIILAVSAALGGCTMASAYRQTSDLVGRPVTEAVACYGPPDQPVSEGAHAYSWSRGRMSGACKLAVKVDGAGRITNASVVAVGFDTCKTVLKHSRPG